MKSTAFLLCVLPSVGSILPAGLPRDTLVADHLQELTWDYGSGPPTTTPTVKSTVRPPHIRRKRCDPATLTLPLRAELEGNVISEQPSSQQTFHYSLLPPSKAFYCCQTVFVCKNCKGYKERLQGEWNVMTSVPRFLYYDMLYGMWFMADQIGHGK